MTIRSGFFNSINGDRKYEAGRFAEYFATFIGNGIFPNPSTGFQVIANNNMTITIKPGRAWINGYIVINDEDLVLSLETADGLLNRIDRVALRYDVVGREITPVIKKGDSATVPSVKLLQRDDDAYELGLADIRIDKGSISISQSNITDLRLNRTYCGIVHGLIDQVDTTTLFNQYQDWIREKKDEYNTDLINYTTDKKKEINTWFSSTSTQLEKDFNTWFTTIQDVLDENTAGNLYNLIEAIPKVLSGMTEPVGLRTGDIWLREI